jgi:hypothetical protein
VRRALVAAALAALSLAASPAIAQEAATARLSLASQTAWVGSDAAFTMRLDVDRVRRPQQLELAVTIHRAVTSRSQFARTIDGELLGSTVHADRVPFPSLRFDAGGAVPVTIDLPSLRAGVYPVEVALIDTADDETVSSFVTHLVRVPDDDVEHPLRVAWVQAYGVDPSLATDGTTALSTDELDELRSIAAHLDTFPMTVVPTPETIAALATVDDGQTLDALARLLADHQVLASTFVDVDISALVTSGLEADIGRQRIIGDAVLGDSLRIPADTRTWSLEGPVSDAALRALRDIGVRRVVLDEAAMLPLDADATGGLTLTRPFAIEGARGTELDAVAVDEALGAHLEEPDDVLGAHHLLADLAVLHADLPGTERGVVIRPPDSWTPSDVFLGVTLANIASSPLLEPVTVSRVFDEVAPLAVDDEPVVREVAPSAPGALGFAAGDLARARGEMGSLESLLADATSDELELLDRLLLVAESADLSASERASYVRAVSQRVGAAAGGVRVVGASTYRLTAREGTIPLSLVNDNDVPVEVDVVLTSDKLTFTDSNTVGSLRISKLVLEPKRTTTRAVPVKARTSGAFQLGVTVRSPDGRLELGATRITITSTVASGVGILLSVGAGAFLLLWWASHWRTVRRARRLVPADD